MSGSNYLVLILGVLAPLAGIVSARVLKRNAFGLDLLGTALAILASVSMLTGNANSVSEGFAGLSGMVITLTGLLFLVVYGMNASKARFNVDSDKWNRIKRQFLGATILFIVSIMVLLAIEVFF